MIDKTINYIIMLFQQPYLFLGMLAMLGLMLQKKSLSEIIQGTVKTIIGVLILFQGIDMLIEVVTPLSEATKTIFTIKTSNILGNFSDFINDNSLDIGLVMIISFILNLFIARFTPFKSIFLTANFIFWFAMLFLSLGRELEIPRHVNIILSSIFTTMYLIIPSNLLRPFVKELSNSDQFTIGHTTSIFCFLGIVVGKIIGNPKHSAEEIKLPKQLLFFTDTNITSGIIMFLTYLIISIINIVYLNVLIFESQDPFLYSLSQGMLFSAGTIVLLMGSRMILSEIVPAFKGIADILVPEAVPALDVPMIFSFGMNSLIIGFIVSVFSSLVTLVFLGLSGYLEYALIPLIIACYFDVAPGAIFANKKGGIVAVIVSSFLGGILLMLLCAFSLSLVSSTTGTFIQTYGGNDFSLWLLLVYPVFLLFK